MAGRIKVVKLDGPPIKLPRAYWRAVCYVGPGALRPVPYLLGLSFGAATIGASIITLVSGTYRLVNVIMALADRDRQRALHDRLAGTRVIHVG